MRPKPVAAPPLVSLDHEPFMPMTPATQRIATQIPRPNVVAEAKLKDSIAKLNDKVVELDNKARSTVRRYPMKFFSFEHFIDSKMNLLATNRLDLFCDSKAEVDLTLFYTKRDKIETSRTFSLLENVKTKIYKNGKHVTGTYKACKVSLIPEKRR